MIPVSTPVVTEAPVPVDASPPSCPEPAVQPVVESEQKDEGSHPPGTSQLRLTDQVLWLL